MKILEYKIHQYRFDNFTEFEAIIREAMNLLGHKEGNNPDINIYNHCYQSEVSTNRNIIFKPTAPTSKHFALDTIGYANSSSLAFKEPDWIKEFVEDSNYIQSLIDQKTNKWDDSILLQWKKARDIASDHILIIGQVPTDETVNGFGFGDHFKKLSMIVDYLQDENLIVKLHPSPKMKIKGKVKDKVDKWIQNGIDVRTKFESIHDFLPKTKVAILENSTAGIECLMHGVPVISYGWPEYHWVTKNLQTLTQLDVIVNDLSWHDKDDADSFIHWYINKYLCHDVNSTATRLKEIIEWKL